MRHVQCDVVANIRLSFVIYGFINLPSILFRHLLSRMISDKIHRQMWSRVARNPIKT